MRDSVLLVGATGAIGKRLAPLLVDAGYEVFGTTRSKANSAALEAAAVTPVVVDVFDARAVTHVLASIRPQVVINQLTDLRGLDPNNPAEALARNARIRVEGTANLVAAALDAGVQRMIAQSIAWAYAPSTHASTEDDALDLSAEGTRATTVRGVVALERLTMHSAPIAGTVLRYGRLYGPGTARTMPGERPVLHVDAAAYAALLVLQKAPLGIFNIVEDGDLVANANARRTLGWDPGFRLDRQ